MNKKRPPQKKTPPTDKLNIPIVEDSPKQVELPQSQPATASIETPVEDAASPPLEEPAAADISSSAPVSVNLPPADESTPAQSASSDSSPDQQAFFQAVGIITGDITLDEDKTLVTVGERTYKLYYSTSHKRAYEALKKEIETTGITQQRLIVYPRITHFPGGKQPYQLAFKLVGFVGHSVSGEGISSELEDLEFKISGLWQFIPVCRIPCISIFRNFNKQRLEYIKSAALDKKVNFMKASHIPVLWRDAPVPPFRFNPKLDKEAQGKAFFVQIKARFNSERNTFEFLSLLAIPSGEPPNYLKAAKKDKLEATKTKLAASKARKRSSSSVPDNNAAPKPCRATSSPKPKPKVVKEQ